MKKKSSLILSLLLFNIFVFFGSVNGQNQMLTDANFSLIRAEVVYNGSAQPAGLVTTGEGISSDCVLTYQDSEGKTYDEKTIINANVYAVTLTCPATDTFGALTNFPISQTYTIAKAELTAENFTFAPSISEYNGQARPVTVMPDVTLGPISIKYNGLTEEPIERGVYEIAVSVEESRNFKAAIDLPIKSADKQNYAIVGKVPAARDFRLNPSNAPYTGAPVSLSVEPIAGISGMGEITIIGWDTDMDISSGFYPGTPTMTGTYYIVFNVAEGTEYGAVSNLLLPFAIMPTAMTSALSDSEKLVSIRWEHGPNKPELPESATIRLYDQAGNLINGSEQPVTEQFGWKLKYTGLMPNAVYRVEEIIPEGYIVLYDHGCNAVSAECAITNVLNEMKSKKVIVEWDDRNDEKKIRPQTLQISLKRNAIVNGDPITLPVNASWEYQWDNLPKKDASGNAFSYAIKEIALPAGYRAEISPDCYTLEGVCKISYVLSPEVAALPVAMAGGSAISDSSNLTAEESPSAGFANAQATVSKQANLNPVPNERTAPMDMKPFWGASNFPAGSGFIIPETGFSTRVHTPLRVQPKSLDYRALGLELDIPSLYIRSEIVSVPLDGNRWAVDWLHDRAGLLSGSKLPGEGNCFLAGHNHLNAQESGPFLFLRDLKQNDRIFIRKETSELLQFRVVGNQLFENGGMENVALEAAKIRDGLTLMTCEDEDVNGGYLHRRVIFAEQVS